MLVEKVSVSRINPAIYNSRIDLKPEDLEYQKLEQSLANFGYVDPIIWNKRTGNLVGGHQRFKILLKQGLTEVEASIVDLSLEKEKALNLALNKIQGKWDYEKLASLLDELTKIPNFDVGITGFDNSEISQIFDRYGEQKNPDDFDFNTTLENIKEPVTKRGDIIVLGSHIIFCGDSSNPDDMKTLMGNEKADILDCDFPYNVSYMQKNNHPSADTRPKKSRKWPQIYSDNMPQAEYEEFMKTILTFIKQYLKPGSAIYIWQGLRQFPPMYQMLFDLDFHVSCFLVWLKESAAITYADYCYRTEQALYGWLKGAPHYWAGKPGESNVWEVHRDPTKSYWHPTQKPVQLAQRALQNSSKIGDIVLDTFLGSGSVLIGAESLNRRCFGMEIDPHYCDAIVKRYISFVGADKVSSEIRDKYLSQEVTK